MKMEGVKVKIRSNGEWLNFKLKTVGKFLPVVLNAQKSKYGAQIILKNGRAYLHLQIPF